MQKILDCVGNKMNDKLLKQCFIYTFILGLIAHGYGFTNLLISHDSLNSFSIANQWPKAGLGRIFYVFYITLTRGRIVLPWMIGVLTLCWISLAVYLIVRIFQTEDKWFVMVVAGICVTNPSVYATAATYMHDLDANAFALFLAVFAVVLWRKSKLCSDRKKKVILLTIAAIILSITLGIYQSYISVTITLIILLSIYDLLNKEKGARVLSVGLTGIAMLGATAVLYLVELKVFSKLTGISAMNSDYYNSLGNMSSVLSGNVFAKIVDTYKSFFTAYKNFIHTSDPEPLFLMVLFILAVGILYIGVLGLMKMHWTERAIFILLGLLMPFGMNISSFLSNGMFHVLMQYAVWFFYLTALVLLFWFLGEKSISEKIKKIFFPVIMLCLFLIIIENIQTANTIYVKKNLEAQSTLSYMTRVADKMEEQKEYIPGETPVVFIGEYAVGVERAGFEKYEVIVGAGSKSPITYESTYKKYFRYVLGRVIEVEDSSQLKTDERVLKMPVFPKEGSISMIGDVLVVKLK